MSEVEELLAQAADVVRRFGEDVTFFSGSGDEGIRFEVMPNEDTPTGAEPIDGVIGWSLDGQRAAKARLLDALRKEGYRVGRPHRA